MRKEWQVPGEYITRTRVGYAFIISVILIMAVMFPALRDGLEVPFIKYVWMFCSVVMLYHCLLSKEAKPFQDIGGSVICIVLGPIAVMALLMFYLLAKIAERKDMKKQSNQGDNRYV